MNPANRLDISLAVAVTFGVLAYVLANGDSLYLGIWYYFAAPAAMVLIALWLRVGPYFALAASIGLALTYLPYFYVQLTAARPEGLLGLGHMFSVPGAALGLITAASVLKRAKQPGKLEIVVFGSTLVLAGFGIANLALCNSMLYCGKVLSFALTP